MCSILLKTCLNRGNHDLKFDLCVRMLGKQQKKLQVIQIPKEMNILNSCFLFLKLVT